MWSLGGTPGPIPLGYKPCPATIKLPVWTAPRTTRVQGPSFSHSSEGSSLRRNSAIQSLSDQSDLAIRWTLDPGSTMTSSFSHAFVIFLDFSLTTHSPLFFVCIKLGQRSYSHMSRHTFGLVSLGARGGVLVWYISNTLWGHGQSTHLIPSGFIPITFKMFPTSVLMVYPPSYFLGHFECL